MHFDVPGVGLSPVTQWPYRHWMVARWARKLSDRLGFDSVDVMGVSWGGALAQQFAFQYRNRVNKLILCATSSGMTMIPAPGLAVEDGRYAPLHRSGIHAREFRQAVR
ncbi:MAG: alpha/beta fold hydrolase [Hyphomonadaceae bacterium]|nr:alpha/beta fold hydrolase [Hyphomonadaceae bacterium]